MIQHISSCLPPFPPPPVNCTPGSQQCTQHNLMQQYTNVTHTNGKWSSPPAHLTSDSAVNSSSSARVLTPPPLHTPTTTTHTNASQPSLAPCFMGHDSPPQTQPQPLSSTPEYAAHSNVTVSPCRPAHVQCLSSEHNTASNATAMCYDTADICSTSPSGPAGMLCRCYACCSEHSKHSRSLQRRVFPAAPYIYTYRCCVSALMQRATEHANASNAEP
jgi:hypothetical protein